MKKHKNYYAFCTKLVENRDDWSSALRSNLFVLLEQPGVTLQKLADSAGVKYETLKAFLYGNSKNCKIGPIVNIAHAFGLSLDELVGAGTLSSREKLFLHAMRTLPEPVCYFYEWGLKTMIKNCAGYGPESKVVPLLKPALLPDGNIKPIHVSEVFDVSLLNDSVRSKVKMALQLPGDAYMPKYSPFDVLLLANDRPPRFTEDAVIIYDGFVWLCRIENGGVYSIRDGSFRCHLDAVDEVVGYIAAINRVDYL